MKKLLAFAALFAVVALTSCKYDDDDLWNSVHGLENRVAKLEELCKQMNTNISSLQTIVTALQNNVYVTGTTPLMKDGKEIGYTITFSKGNPITIYHGKDGQDGEDGTTPTISVKKDTDGVYYWTLNGEFIVVDGGKIQAEGKDGTNGTNGTTPQFKIENDYWFVSYDNGANWTQLGKATGEDGIGGDSIFSGVDYETSTDYVIFTLSNGTQIKLPTWSAFEALQRLCNETNTNLSALQTIVTALQNNDYITSVDPLTENGKVVGYTIKFAKSNPIVIYNGKDGADGVDGNTPVIGVKKDTDDIYYWTLDGEFIVVDGQKIKAQGTDGNNGTDGSDGVTPKLEIREGYWWLLVVAVTNSPKHDFNRCKSATCRFLFRDTKSARDKNGTKPRKNKVKDTSPEISLVEYLCFVCKGTNLSLEKRGEIPISLIHNSFSYHCTPNVVIANGFDLKQHDLRKSGVKFCFAL